MIKYFLVFLILVLSKTSFAEVRCQNLFDNNFLPLSEGSQALKMTDLFDKTSVRIRGISEFKRIYQDRYVEFAKNFYEGMAGGNAGLNFLEKVKIENPQLQVIVYHPGIVTRSDDFIKFISTKGKLTAAQALNQFSKHLGSKTLYRALNLSDEQLTNLKNKNLLSSGLNSALINNKHIDFNNFNLIHDIRLQFRFSSGLLPLSVTEFPDVALAVAHQIKRSRSQSAYKVVLFTLEVPIVDTLELPISFQGSLTIYKNSINVLDRIEYGPRIESFVLFGINDYEIKKMEESENADYKFQFH